MMNQVASQTEIGKICSKQSPCSTPRLSRPAHTPSVALSHGQDPELPKLQRSITLWPMCSTTSQLVQGNLGRLKRAMASASVYAPRHARAIFRSLLVAFAMP